MLLVTSEDQQSGRTRSAQRLDVTEQPNFLFNLLNFTWSWRERLVEELIFGAAEHVRVVSSYQVRIPPALTELFQTGGEETLLAHVPLTTRPKRALLQLDLTGPAAGPAHLLPRGMTAELQRLYLRTLASDEGLSLTGAPDDLLEAICAFSPGVLVDYYVNELASGDLDRGIVRYLNEGLALGGPPVHLSDVRRWCAAADRCRGPLLAHLPEPPLMTSSSENVILALPEMRSPPTSVREIDVLVDRYEAALTAAAAQDAGDLLATLAEYGRRWQVVMEVELPIGERVTIRLAEDRPLNLQPWSFSRQRFALGDAASGHLEARTEDSNVRIGRYRAASADGERVGIPVLETARVTGESISLYSSNEDRPDLLDVDVQLLPRAHVVMVSWLLIALNIVASWIALTIGAENRAEKLAVLAIPTTLAAASLLVREQSALGALLQRRLRFTLAFSLALLWMIAIIRLE